MITLTTIVYEKNFRDILSKESWFIKFTNKLITDKTIIVNNVESIDVLNEISKEFNVNLVFVRDNLNVIDKYNLNINENTIGYNYTIPYFVAIENVNTKFMLNVASDCMDDIKVSSDFIDYSIIELMTNPYCSSTMIKWGYDNKINEVEQINTNNILNINYNISDKFNHTIGYTDQFFLAEVDYLKGIEYNQNSSVHYHGDLSYGGNSFERRIATHQFKNKIFNFIFKSDDYYIHDNKYKIKKNE